MCLLEQGIRWRESINREVQYTPPVKEIIHTSLIDMWHHLNQKEPTKTGIFFIMYFLFVFCCWDESTLSYHLDIQALIKIRHFLILFLNCTCKHISKTVFPVTLGDVNELRARFSQLKKNRGSIYILVLVHVKAGDVMWCNVLQFSFN